MAKIVIEVTEDPKEINQLYSDMVLMWLKGALTYNDLKVFGVPQNYLDLATIALLDKINRAPILSA